jgi:ribonuclease BN (tRNA processing enzyme)
MQRTFFFLTTLTLWFCPGLLKAQGDGSSDSTFVVLLGTGMPRPDPKAQGPATAVVYGGRVFLFDAGPGVERQLGAARLPIKGVEAVFITHLHSDHTLGYPDLIFTSWVMGRKTRLQVYGPKGLQKMTDHLIAAWEEDIKIRIEGLEHQTTEGYKVDVHEIQEGIVYDSAGIKIIAIPVPHGNWPLAYAYKIVTPNRTIVISGDTKYSEALEKASLGVDVLVHEVYPSSKVKPENRPGGDDWPQYLKEFHTSDLELGNLASRALPKLLVLTHIVRMGATDSEILEGIRLGGFKGTTIVGYDLQKF